MLVLSRLLLVVAEKSEGLLLMKEASGVSRWTGAPLLSD
jgi:hypothetical protein